VSGLTGEKRLNRTLVIGFGNVYRRDDGVAYALLNALRERLGRPPLGTEDDGFDDLGHQVDTLLLHQLVPELAENVVPYERVIFVDAHMGQIPELIHEEELDVCYKSATVSHTLHPCSVLAISQELHGRAPQGILLSIRGYDFEFGEGLSEQTAALLPEALDRVLALAQTPI
jgi:hydrogenase maturation protease